MRAASRSEAIRAVVKHGLVDYLQHLAQRVLHYLVLDRAHPDRSGLAPLFRDMHASYRLMSIALRSDPLAQLSQVFPAILPVLLLAHTIDAHRRILANAAVGSFECWLVYQTCQLKDRSFWISLRSLCYPQESR